MPPKNPMTEGEALAVLPDYDAGLLNDYGGGNVEWWQDYLRAEIGRANDYWRENIATLTAHTAASGGEVVGYIVHSADELTRFEATQEAICLGIGRHAVYATPPAAVPADALTNAAEFIRSLIPTMSDSYNRELAERTAAALIPKGADHEQR